MSATISIISVNNFRSCSASEFSLSAYTPLVGYNNSGKSNIISAISWLLRRSSLSASDYQDTSVPVVISGTIVGVDENILLCLQERHAAQIRPYIHEEKLVVRRTQRAPDAKVTDIIFEVFDPTSGAWRPNPTGIDNALSSIFPEPLRIEAMDDAAEDASKAKSSTTIGKLLQQFITPIKDAHEAELNTHLNEVAKRISSTGECRLDELSAIDQSINTRISDLFPGISLKLHFDTPSIDELIRTGTIRVYENDGIGRAFTSYGHGAQRSIQMALLRHLAETRRGTVTNSTTLLLIDEPELYLHPFAIEHVREALKSLSENGYQVIFSTHSAQMITSNDAQNVLLIRKINGSTGARARLCDAIQRIVPQTVHQMEHLFELSNSSQILFAERVIFTEGKTEQRLIPTMFRLHTGASLGQCNIALVGQNGVDNTGKSRAILSAMDIPSLAITDLDYAFRGAISHGYISEADPDILSVKGVFARLAPIHGFLLDDKGLPKKGGACTAAEAFEIVAAAPDAAGPIDSIHERLKAMGIWIWKKGSIEAPLGLTCKTESAWAAFARDATANGLFEACNDPATVIDLLNWVNS